MTDSTVNQATGEIEASVATINPAVKRMSIDFARESINKIEREVDSSSSFDGSNKPRVIIVGESHGESLVYAPLDKEPDLQATYAAFSSLQIAEKKVGAKNVILAVELSSKELNKCIERILSNNPFINGIRDITTQSAIDSTMINAIVYAMDHGYPIVAADPQEGNPRGEEGVKREQLMYASYAAIAARNPSAMVVGIVGALHLSSFAGLKSEDVTLNNGNIAPDLQNSPLRPYYSSITLVNAAYLDDKQTSLPLKDYWAQEVAAGYKFATNPDYVLQNHAPQDLRLHIGRTLAASDIAQHVEEAFREHNLIKGHAQILNALPTAAQNDILSRPVDAQEVILGSMKLALARQNTVNNAIATHSHI